MKPAILATIVSLLASALPASAADRAVESIAFRDFNRNGKIDRAILAINNPDYAIWSVQDAAGLAISYNGAALRLSDVFVATAASNPALVEAVIDESDSRLPVSTSIDGFSVSYARVGASGIRAAGTELAPFDTKAAAISMKDEAGPILLSSTPVEGSSKVLRTIDITLTFSEKVEPSSLATDSSQNPGAWLFTPSDAGRKIAVSHYPYNSNVNESFGISAKDPAGNVLVRGSYPNPFSFRTTDDTTPTTLLSETFSLTQPHPMDALIVDQPTVIAWYDSIPNLASVRLSYSADSGQTYADIAEVPASAGTYVWYPSKSSSSVTLRATGLDSTGSIVSLSSVYPLSLSGESSPLQVISGPTVTAAADSSVLVTVRLDRTPASASLACSGLPAVKAVLYGDRPVRAEARLAGMAPGVDQACEFLLTDSAGALTRLPVPALRIEADSSGPVLTGPAVIDGFDAAARTAKLSWTTDEPSTSSVVYGAYQDYGGRAEATALSMSHEIVLGSLTPGAMHQVRITSIDAKGNAAVSRDYYFIFLREGELIKGSGPAVYRYAAGKRYAFPHLDVYRSWYGEDFSKVIRVPDTQLGTIPLGGNVKMKEGVYLIKIQSDPKTYAVEPNGALRWIQSEEQAIGLYGSAWAKRVRDVDVSLFTDYSIGAPLQPGERPAGYSN